MIFQLISLFLSFCFAYFHLFIYILPYLTHTRRIEERFIPPLSGTTATSLRLCFHCDCVLHLILQLLAINLRPITTFSIEFLSHCITSYCIALHTSHHRIAHR